MAADEQRLVLVLAVQVDERPDALGQRAHRRHLAVERAPAAAVGADPALRDELFAAGEEAAFDRRLRRSGANGAGVRALAEKQLERADQRRLPRARLAGERGHAGPELEPGLLDQREVADVEFFEHVSPRRTRRRRYRRSAARPA